MNEFTDEDEEVLAEILGAMLDRKNRGEPIDFDAIKAEHPRFTAEIDSFFGMGDVFSDALGDAVLDRAFGDDEIRLAAQFPLADRLTDSAWGSVHELRAEGGALPRELISIDPCFSAAARARIASSIRHATTYQTPGFLRILAEGRLDTRSYLVREKLTGPSIGELIDRMLESGRMLPEVEEVADAEGRPVDRATWAEACAGSRRHLERVGVLLRAWAEILDLGHRRGLVHRQLDSESLGIDGSGQPVIQGIGLAWQGTGIAPESLKGWAPQWLAPEIVDSQWGPVTHLADVYSLGRALADTLSLRPSTQIEDCEGELMRIAVGDRSFTEDLPSGLPEGLVDLIEAATFPDPLRRLSSLAEFADRLATVLPRAEKEPRGWAARLFGR